MKIIFCTAAATFLFSSILLNSAFADVQLKREQELVRVKRDLNVGKIIEAALQVGESLTGVSLNALRDAESVIAVSGEVTNPTKWEFSQRGCDRLAGEINVPLRTIGSDMKEAFAGHSGSGIILNTGSSIKCRLRFNKQFYLHFAYKIPTDTIITSNPNVLSIGICKANETKCSGLTGKDMLDKPDDYSFVCRKIFKDSVSILRYCEENICVAATMGTSKKTNIHLDIYPMKFDDLSFAVKAKMKINGKTKADYNEYLDDEFDGIGNSAHLLTASLTGLSLTVICLIAILVN